MNQSPVQINELTAVLPYSYLPSIDQYCTMMSCSTVMLEAKETYPKQTCRNRTTILSANGPLRLTVPVIKPYGNKTKTAEVIIDNKSRWNIIHWRAIYSAYSKSPFFLYYKDELEQVLMSPVDLLTDFNLSLINLLNKYLKLKRYISPTVEFVKQYSPENKYLDLRNCSKDDNETHFELYPYTQVFSDRFPFIPNLSIIDLLFNEGPYSTDYLKKCANPSH